MRRVAEDNAEASRILMSLLDAVEKDRAHSQRHLAAELGIALGLVNAYLKRCVKKGLVKVRQAPARRYAYYITPQGFAEKSRLTVDYLSNSLGIFRLAKREFAELFRAAKLRGVKRIVLVGKSDLAEIAALSAMEYEIEIVGLVQGGGSEKRFMGLPLFADFDAIDCLFDCLLITDMRDARDARDKAIARFGEEQVLVPDLLRVRTRKSDGGRSDEQ